MSAIIILLLSVSFVLLLFLRTKKPFYEYIIYILYVLSFIVLLVGFMANGNEYDVAIDVVSEGYTPLGGKHFISMLFYFIMYQVAIFSLWKKGRKLPPLYAVLSLIFVFTGIILNVFILLQVTGYSPDHISDYSDPGVVFLPIIILSIIIGISLTIKMIRQEADKAEQRTFKNKFLNTCNTFLSKRYDVYIWALILMFPVLIALTIILMLFGQDYNSLVKVFTETATLRFSQHVSPFPLPHEGHYLCTVAAKESPKVVKPVRLGKRGGRIIIVNRQLQIANAFEELLSDFAPNLHRFIRYNYDKYGYDLSKKINNTRASNITYILMKPLEWVFLICLYLCVVEPEKKIKKQYG